MFERFTDRARGAVVLAQEEARALGHNYIGTEHILLGLLRDEEGLAAQALQGLGIALEPVRAQIVRIIGSSDESVGSGQIPFTPRAKKVLELSLRESLSLGQNYIGTEHLMLGLARENEGVAARIMLDFDTDSDMIRAEVARLLPGPGVAPGLTEIRSRRPTVAHAAVPIMPHWELRLLAQLAFDIARRHGRQADEGDCVLALSTAPGSLLAVALAELAIDEDTLADAVDRARRAGPARLDRDRYKEALLRARARLGLDDGEPPAS